MIDWRKLTLIEKAAVLIIGIDIITIYSLVVELVSNHRLLFSRYAIGFLLHSAYLQTLLFSTTTGPSNS